jgi:hypothetical protein
MAEEPMPIELLRHAIPRPVRLLGIGEDDPGVLVLVGIIAPDVPLPLRRPLRRRARALEPWVLVGRVVDHQLRDDADAALMRLLQERLEVLDQAVRLVNLLVRRDVVAIVLERRRVEGQEPDGIDAERLDVVELRGEAGEVAVAVGIAVDERFDVYLVDDRVLVPVRILDERLGRHLVPLHAAPPRSSRRMCAGSCDGSSRT